MKIKCADIAELTAVCAGLVQQGIMFEASTTRLTVTCTGGY